jgi:hypothetical protein
MGGSSANSSSWSKGSFLNAPSAKGALGKKRCNRKRATSIYCDGGFRSVTQMLAHGYKAMTQGVAMHRPYGEGFNRAYVYAMDDWR